MAVSLLILIVFVLMRNSVQDYVNLNYQGLSSIPEDKVTRTVTYLNAEHNKIFELDSIPDMPFLKDLHLGYNRLYEFPNLENSTETLCNLYLEYNNITYINPDRLDALTNLKMLFLMNNHISSIPDVAGPSLTLTYLDLMDNRFTNFPDWEFFGNSLSYLNLKDNQISEITEDMFRNMTKLENLVLDQNLITSPQFSLSATLRLSTLSIRANGLSIFPDIRNMTTLTTLYLSDNKLFSIPEEIFSCLTSLQTLNLQRNNLSLDAIPDVVELNHTLTVLNVGSNPIIRFPRWTHLSKALTDLTISTTSISELTDDDLDYYPFLTFLDLSNSNISEFPSLPRNGPQLETLLLNYNNIERITESQLQPLQNLSLIGCKYNQLVSIPNLCVASFVAHFLFDVNGNSLTCDVNMVWALGASKAIPNYHLNITSSKCMQPLSLKDRAILTVPIGEMENPSGTKFIDREYFPIEPPFNCYLPITVLQSTSNSLECAVTCSQTPLCLIFGFEPDVGDDLRSPGTCAIATLTGTALQTNSVFKWFAPF